MTPQTPDLRALDAQIAVALFGWRWERKRDRNLVAIQPPYQPEPVVDGWQRWNYAPENWDDVTGREAEFERFSDWDNCCSFQQDGRQVSRGLPHYSSDWNAAASVIEKLTQADCKLAIYTRGFQWEVVVWWKGGTHEEHFADTLPLAICAAALACVRQREAVGEKRAGSGGADPGVR